MNQQSEMNQGDRKSKLTAQMLADASPEQQKNMIGRNLFPRIQSQQPEKAGKITGMLLESMDISELLNLLEDPSALTKKINEAVQVLKDAGR